MRLEDIVRRQGGRCYICGERFSLRRFGALHRDAPTADHVIPKVRGGGRHANILAAHRRCNEARGSAAPTEIAGELLWRVYGADCIATIDALGRVFGMRYWPALKIVAPSPPP